MTEKLSYYLRRGYAGTHRAEQYGFRRVYFRKPPAPGSMTGRGFSTVSPPVPARSCGGRGQRWAVSIGGLPYLGHGLDPACSSHACCWPASAMAAGGWHHAAPYWLSHTVQKVWRPSACNS
jgi:hypothetical protein